MIIYEWWQWRFFYFNSLIYLCKCVLTTNQIENDRALKFGEHTCSRPMVYVIFIFSFTKNNILRAIKNIRGNHCARQFFQAMSFLESFFRRNKKIVVKYYALGKCVLRISGLSFFCSMGKDLHTYRNKDILVNMRKHLLKTCVHFVLIIWKKYCQDGDSNLTFSGEIRTSLTLNHTG